MVSQRLHHGLAFQRDDLLQTDILRRGTHLHFILSGGDVPLTLVLMTVEAELLGIEFHLHGLGLTGLEFHAGKALQLLRADLLLLVCRRQVDLHHLICSHLTRVLHLKRYVHTLGRCGHLGISLQVLILKRGVTQTVAEGPGNPRILLSLIVIADGLVDLHVRITDREFR